MLESIDDAMGKSCDLSVLLVCSVVVNNVTSDRHLLDYKLCYH